MTITIPKDLSNYIESLQYECEARKDLCAFMINKGMADSEAFNRYHKEYMEFFAQLETAKNEMANEYIPKGKKWNLDFATSQVTFDD